MPADECPSAAVLTAFHAGDLPPADIDRVAEHLEHCPSCESHLDSLDGGDSATLANAFRRMPDSGVGVRAVVAAGAVVGERYTLVERIGEGGMGSVWLARQAVPVKRKVALKLVKLGMDSRQVLARFEVERQALALMDHPNIARVLDGGVTPDGRPFFVMELVKGTPITQFCDERKLTPRQRLELFVPVCHAIQHAHMKGVIHRDIKPSNVLVTEYDDRPTPKVIDFGVAKATGGRLSQATIDTVAGGVVGTPAYMSPEQTVLTNQDIDTRSDVYSLGVLLYELLTGTPPISEATLADKGLDEVLRVVREEEAPRPSTRVSTADAAVCRGTNPRTLTALLRGELDWIVLKALEKDRARRYESAGQLAADVSRFLAGEEVLAHPPTTSYRLRKFLRRNRQAALTAAAVAAALVAGIVGTSVGMVAANTARNELAIKADGERAAKELAETEAVAARRAKERAERARDRTADVLDAMTSAATRDSLSTQLALTPEQRRFLDNALTYYRELAAESSDDEAARARTAAAAYRVGMIEFRLGRKPEAEAALRAACERFDKLVAESPAHRGRQVFAHLNLGSLLSETGRDAAAEEQLRTAMRHAAAFAATAPAVDGVLRVSQGRGYLGTVFHRTGRLREAESQFQAAVDKLEPLASKHPDLANVRDQLARALNSLGLVAATGKNWSAAEAHYRRALAVAEKLAADAPSESAYRHLVALINMNLGAALRSLGQLPAAREHSLAAVRDSAKLAADFPGAPMYRVSLAGAWCNHGSVLVDSRRYAESLGWFDRAVGVLTPLVAADPTDRSAALNLRNSHWGRAKAFEKLGRSAEAVREWGRAVELAPPDDREGQSLRVGLAGGYCNLGNDTRNRVQRDPSLHWLAASLAWYDRAIGLLNPIHAAAPTDAMAAEFLRNSHWGRARALVLLGKHEQSLPDWDVTVRLSAGDSPPLRRMDRVSARLAAGRTAEAVAEVTELATLPGWAGPHLAYFGRVCATASADAGDRREEYAALAVKLLRKAVDTGWKGAEVQLKLPAFAPLQNREDFQKLLAEVGK